MRWVAAEGASMLGTAVSTVVLPLLVYDITGSAAKTGLLFAFGRRRTVLPRLPCRPHPPADARDASRVERAGRGPQHQRLLADRHRPDSRLLVLDRDDDQHRHHLSPAGRTGPPSIQRQRHRTDGRLGGRPFDARVPAASLAAVLGSRRSVYDFSDAAVPLDRLGSLLGSTVGVARHVRLPDGGAPPVSAPFTFGGLNNDGSRAWAGGLGAGEYTTPCPLISLG